MKGERGKEREGQRAGGRKGRRGQGGHEEGGRRAHLITLSLQSFVLVGGGVRSWLAHARWRLFALVGGHVAPVRACSCPSMPVRACSHSFAVASRPPALASHRPCPFAPVRARGVCSCVLAPLRGARGHPWLKDTGIKIK